MRIISHRRLFRIVAIAICCPTLVTIHISFSKISSSSFSTCFWDIFKRSTRKFRIDTRYNVCQKISTGPGGSFLPTGCTQFFKKFGNEEFRNYTLLKDITISPSKHLNCELTAGQTERDLNLMPAIHLGASIIL